MKKYVHGGAFSESETDIDFSVNLNPLGMPENVKEAIANSADKCIRYPDADCTELTAEIAEHEYTEPGQIVCGNGAADLIYRIIMYVKPENAVICVPTFSEYEKALTENNCRIHRYYLHEECDFKMESDILEMLTADIDMLVLCNPNNPTGRLISPELLEKITEKCIENHIIILCDECFIDFTSEGHSGSIRCFMRAQTIILKAFTKLYSMPGIRLGYAVFGSKELAEAVHNTGQFWSVSAPAQLAGAAALKKTDWINKTVGIISAERNYLSEELKKSGFKVCHSDANFILFYSEHPLNELLIPKKIVLRDCSDFEGLGKGWYRTAVRTHIENVQLINALRECLNG
ncbi:MAG: aminotransferase class I/II-fold pyridoxal phosphate-dependent enzyme [Ruminococcus sp.]|nr:aminotransferase class I/II-fold pyridoxal phosphate-dependent enzyme [Ruminococcus sp.]